MSEKFQISMRLVSVIDHAETGRLAREYRKSKGISLRATARRMKRSAPFVSDLERGNRNWTERLVELFHWAVNWEERLNS